MDFFRESLRLQLIRELPEFVEIDTQPKPERMGNRFRRGMASGRDAGANCWLHSLPFTCPCFAPTGTTLCKRRSSGNQCQSRAHLKRPNSRALFQQSNILKY
jgi:hypothetical protein